MPVLVVIFGIVIGLALGAFGGGGSVLAVPALVHVMGQDPVTATMGSLIIVGTSAVLSLPAHHRAKRVRLGQGLVFGLLGTVGSIAGSSAARAVPASVLMTTFAAVMVVVSVLMFRREPKGDGSPSEGSSPCRRADVMPSGVVARRAAVVAAATLVGVLTGFLGVGGGFLVVPALVLVLEFPMPVAVGTSLLVVAVNSATALGTRALHGLGDLDWPLVLGFSAAAVVGSVLGSRVVDRVPAQRLSQAFALVLVAVAVVTSAQFVPDLLP